MNMIQKIEHWGDQHHTRWLDVIRIVLGLVILLKGISFISDTEAQQEWIMHNNAFSFSGAMAIVVIHIVAFTHIVGGILITLGLVTRFAVVVQIPILICAIFFVNLTKGFSMLNTELWLSIVVLIMLVVCWIVGSGPMSVDATMRPPRRA